MEKLEFISESGEKLEFFVIEETRINGVNYILVSESEDDEADAYILKDTSAESDEDAAFEFIDDENELEAVGKVFAELMDEDTELL